MSPKDLYSVDEVAERLGLHVRTVRNYVRDGRLKAVRIGKQYRIPREGLEELTGRPASPTVPEAAQSARHTEVSSIVLVDGVAAPTADRISTTLLAAVSGPPSEDGPLRVETVYDRERARLKVIVLGGLGASAGLLRLIDTLTTEDS